MLQLNFHLYLLFIFIIYILLYLYEGVTFRKSIIKYWTVVYYFAPQPGIDWPLLRLMRQRKTIIFNFWSIKLFIYFCSMRRSSGQPIPGGGVKQYSKQLDGCFSILVKIDIIVFFGSYTLARCKKSFRSNFSLEPQNARAVVTHHKVH